MKAAGAARAADFLTMHKADLAAHESRDRARPGGGKRRFPRLGAYIEHGGQRPLSEVRALQRAVEGRVGKGPKNSLATAWSLLGAALSWLGENSLASEAFRQSADLAPDRRQKLVEASNAIFTANACDNMTAADMHRLYEEYRGLLHYLAPLPKRWHDHRRLRVGYLSGDFCLHPVAYFAYALLRHFDPAQFEVYCYAVNQQEDALTERLKRLPVVWRDIRTDDWQEAAQHIYADEIDILVDLSGHTAGNCLPILAYQPAAVQISGIGYMNSTGLYHVDGFLSDVYCASSADAAYFTEPLLRLPRTHLCYTRPHAFPEVVAAPPCQGNGYVTFGCFNNFSKVTDEMLRLWCAILARTPKARLILKHKIFDGEEGRRHVDGRLSAAGFDRSRVEYRGFSAGHLAEYNDIDIALDTAPYTGGLTTCEALYMGVPVVSLTGERHGARFGYSLLNNVGLGDLAAPTPEAYVEIAAALAAAPETLTGLRRCLRSMMARSPLMDGAGYARDMEDLYRSLYAACREEAKEKGHG